MQCITNGQAYIISPYESEKRLCVRSSSLGLRTGRVVRFVQKCEGGVVSAEKASEVKGKPEPVMKDIKGRLLVQPSPARHATGLIQINCGSMLAENIVVQPSAEHAGDWVSALSKKLSSTGLPLFFTQKFIEPCEGAQVKVVSYLWPSCGQSASPSPDAHAYLPLLLFSSVCNLSLSEQ